MPAGRPSEYQPEFCETVIELGKQGFSPAQMCAHFDIARQTIDNWALAHPAFLEAFSRAKVHCQAWWETKGMDGMEKPVFNAPVWKKSMEARFRDYYTERKEVSGPGGKPIEHKDVSARDLLADRIAGLTARIGPEGADSGPDGKAG